MNVISAIYILIVWVSNKTEINGFYNFQNLHKKLIPDGSVIFKETAWAESCHMINYDDC